MSFQFFADAGLTVPASEIVLSRGETPSELNGVVFFGSNVSGEYLVNKTAPGVDPLQVSIVDSAGGGVATTDVKIASSYGGLSSATAGASLDLADTIYSGSSNAVAVYVRVSTSLTTPGEYSDVSLQVDDQLLMEP